MPLAYALDVASSSDTENLLPLVEDLQSNHRDIYENIEQLSADRGYDSAKNNAELYDDHNIKPVIDSRRLWKLESFQTLYGDRYDVFCYDEKGNVYCTCPSTKPGEDEKREMAFVGFEKDRLTLKYRCPAAAFGFECPGRAECEKLSPNGVGEYGRVVRVPLGLDRRIFTPIARHSQKWKNAYKKRTAVERVNGRIDQVPGFEHHTIRGKDKMKMRVGLALVVLLAMAPGRIRAGQTENWRSFVAPAGRAA